MSSLRRIVLCVGLSSCSGGEASGESDTGTGSTGADLGSTGAEPTTGGPQCIDCTPIGPMVHRLPSPPGATLWTATTMDKILREAIPPDNIVPELVVLAARNEYEPFQLAVRADLDTTVTVQLSPFAGPGPLPPVTLHRVDYVKIAAPSDPAAIASAYIPDPLVPIAPGTPIAVAAGQNQPLWFTAHVPADALAGDYTATISIDLGGVVQEVPVRLHVFDFTLPAQIGFDGNWNASFEALGGSASLERVQQLKDFFFAHRLVPSSVAWPAGTNYNGGVEYDCVGGVFVEDPGAYDISQLGPKYIDGLGWNDVGFPSFQALTFVDNATPRPQTFCGVDRGGDHRGTAEYNVAWSKMLAALDAYVVAKGWAGKAYYYVQNEPQGPEDHDIAAYLAALTRAAAPNLRLAISEEPKPEIAEHPEIMGQRYDLWWADLSHFEPIYASARQALGEQVWWYFLYGDLPPHFNPITIDHPGIETRIAHWAAWKYRIRGFAYYSVTGWGADPRTDPRPQGTAQNGDGFLLYPPEGDALVSSIRWELLREGVEDHEYLRLAAGGVYPATPAESVGCDASATSAVSSTTAYTRDASALKRLRDQLGAYLEGARPDCPLLVAEAPGMHPRAPYYLNFQDPAGEPKIEPLVVDGKTWQKLGWTPYSPEQGLGWSGPHIGDPAIMKAEYLADAPVDELQRSILYNDYGRTDTFNFDLEAGLYRVTVSIGWFGKDYPQHRVIVEGAPLFDSVATTAATPYLVQSVDVMIADGNLTLEAGQMDQYTMLNWLSIEPI